MAAVDQVIKLPLSGKMCAALVLLAACLLVGCGPSASKREVADVGAGSGTATSDEPARPVRPQPQDPRERAAERRLREIPLSGPPDLDVRYLAARRGLPDRADRQVHERLRGDP